MYFFEIFFFLSQIVHCICLKSLDNTTLAAATLLWSHGVQLQASSWQQVTLSAFMFHSNNNWWSIIFVHTLLQYCTLHWVVPSAKPTTFFSVLPLWRHTLSSLLQLLPLFLFVFLSCLIFLHLIIFWPSLLSSFSALPYSSFLYFLHLLFLLSFSFLMPLVLVCFLLLLLLQLFKRLSISHK